MTLEPQDREQLIKHRLNRSQETLEEAVLLYKNNMYPAAVNRVYYCMFYALSALAIHSGFQTGKHSRLIGWFNKTYVRTNRVDLKYSKMISRAFDKRMLGDYADIPEFTHQEVEDMISDGEDFIEMIETNI